jgi:pimeloyl-ACP methyl ester carboxylesterase
MSSPNTAASPGITIPPVSLDQQLEVFLAAHPRVRRKMGGAEWSYVRAGEGEQTILLLGGALGSADFAFQVIGELAPRFRVLAPDYPPAGTLEEMTDGIAALLDAEGVARAHVVGGSFGGIVAQVFAQRFPSRVASLVLSHTGAPARGRRRSGAQRILTLLPERLLRTILRKRLRGTLAGADPFWARRFDATVSAMTKADIVSRVRLAAQFISPDDAPFRPAATQRVLILEADDDPLFPEAKRAPLRALYPGAQVHTFHGTGHAAAILQPRQYAEVIRRFVEEGG